jgi:hypothetical protein
VRSCLRGHLAKPKRRRSTEIGGEATRIAVVFPDGADVLSVMATNKTAEDFARDLESIRKVQQVMDTTQPQHGTSPEVLVHLMSP